LDQFKWEQTNEGYRHHGLRTGLPGFPFAPAALVRGVLRAVAIAVGLLLLVAAILIATMACRAHVSPDAFSARRERGSFDPMIGLGLKSLSFEYLAARPDP
jgi:hypothetical protein